LKRVAATFIPPIVIDRHDKPSMHRQICAWFQGAIAEGRMKPGGRVPSSRELAAQLGMSRGSVVNAYEQLLAEGFFETLVGVGTHIAKSIPGEFPALKSMPHPGDPAVHAINLAHRQISDRASLWNNPPTQRWVTVPGAFGVGLPALDQFPVNLWSKLIAHNSRVVSRTMLAYGDPMGYRPLREAIAEYVRTARGVRCDASQVLVTAGSQQGLQIASRVLLNPRDRVCMEEPGYPGAREAFAMANAEIVTIDVDAEGIVVSELERKGECAKLVYVTPSHQYPMGVTMSTERRMLLLNWACHNDTWIIEDDYDSEYRFDGRPIAALQSLDTHARVLYMGTFSQAMYPALRLGYLVLPKDLIAACVAVRDCMDMFSPTLNQSVMAEFIREGHFARHLRRMRMIYIERWKALVEALQSNLHDSVEIAAAEGGLHLVILLHAGVDDAAVSKKAARRGMSVMPLSSCRMNAEGRRGLVLGYGGVDVQGIQEGVRKLCMCIEQVDGMTTGPLTNGSKTRDSTVFECSSEQEPAH
jgi:GntR family transcriptional regulator/MocR family aminotransferase